MSYCICKIKSLPLHNPAQIFTVDSQVLGQSSWWKLTSVLSFDTRHKWKTRQTRFPHKGLEGSSSISEAACSPGFTGVHRDTHMHTFTHTRKGFFNDFICCIFHGSHQHLFCVRSHYSFPPPFNQLHCIQSVLCGVYVPSQCSWAQVTTVLLSLAQRC